MVLLRLDCFRKSASDHYCAPDLSHNRTNIKGIPLVLEAGNLINMPKQQSIKPNTKEQGDEKPERSQVPAILFDLDGTLLDSAYEHEMA